MGLKGQEPVIAGALRLASFCLAGRGNKNAKDDTLWKEVDAEESNWELEKD